MAAATEIFADQTGAAVRESIDRLRNAQQGARQARYSLLEKVYRGGEHIRDLLTKYPAEDAVDYALRQSRRAVGNYPARIADALRDGVWGDEITLSYSQESADERLRELLDWNRWGRKQRKIGWGQTVLGDGWINPAFSSRWGKIGLQPVHASNVMFECDGVNDEEMSLALEYRTVDGERGVKGHYWIWSPEQFNVVDDLGRNVEHPDPGTSNGSTVLGPSANPYGVIPLVRVPGRTVTGADYGLSYIEDAADLAVLLLNWLSDMDQGMIHQVFSLLVTKGSRKATVITGANRHIWVGADGDASYIAPACDFSDMRENFRMVAEMMSDTSSVPMSVIRGGGTANSGYQALLEMQPMIRVQDTMRDDARVSLEEMLRKVSIIAKYHKVADFGTDPEIRVEFAENSTPTDEAAARLQDQADVLSGLMTRADYLIRWNPKITTEEEAIEYLAKIDAEGGTPEEEPETERGGLFANLPVEDEEL